MSAPITPSPGPGWWQAADGKWHRQQWETKMASFETTEGLETLRDKMGSFLKPFGLDPS
jgi:hypothetical protein